MLNLLIKLCICQIYSGKDNIPADTLSRPPGRFQHIHIDLIGPLVTLNNFKYILTVIDRFTRWPEAYPLSIITAKMVAEVFFYNYIPRFGVPIQVISDQVTQFTLNIFKELSNFLGTHNIVIPPAI